ncbi:kynureninase [Thozetella sp. PMI_491]|nr:kynureninase [Thozetella sp. PMI_491]
MDTLLLTAELRAGRQAKFPAHANTRDYAQGLDFQDHLASLRNNFIIPTKGSLNKTAVSGRLHLFTAALPGYSKALSVLAGSQGTKIDNELPAIYFCGHSQGLQPKTIKSYLDTQLDIWQSIGVYGHTKTLAGSPLVAWQDLAEVCAEKSARIVGALPSEVAIMNSLTVNLHLMMASFYRPTALRHKVIIEWRPFPSDYYVVESQIIWHGLDPRTSMIKIKPDENFCISTDEVIATIDHHGTDVAMILLPGVQYYSGQLFDIPRITKHAQEKGILIGWDLAHAAGNVELKLHDWNVDWAVWCNYKYQNACAGATAAAFVHEKHGLVDTSHGTPEFRPRLRGWYGGVKSLRLDMDNNFVPTEGAGGYQMSSPSAIDLAGVLAALSVFDKTNMAALRSKSLLLTAYAEYLLNRILADEARPEASFRIITPCNPLERGAQLSVRVKPELLDAVSEALVDAGVVCDRRKPGVIRFSLSPLYNTFQEAWEFVAIWRRVILKPLEGGDTNIAAIL